MRLVTTAVISLACVAGLGGITARAGDLVPAYIAVVLGDPVRKADSADDARRHAADVMVFTQLKPGQKVLELVPEGGYWTSIFSGIVGSKGHVFTLWPKEFMSFDGDSFKRWQGLAATPKFSNVTVSEAPAADLSVPEPVDLVFTCQNYHDFVTKDMGPMDMAAFDKKVFDALKPGGYFVVIDNVAQAGSGTSAADTLHRIDPEAVKQQVEAVGFVLDGSSDALKNPKDTHTLLSYKPPMAGHNDQFVFRFKKPAR